MISAKIVADSKNKQGDRITTYILTYPRIIHAELMTHRLFSRNSASSRAIPLERMIKSIKENPFIPLAFQLDHSGMQGNQYIEDPGLIKCQKERWIGYSLDACENAEAFNKGIHGMTNKTGRREDFKMELRPNTGVTKQLCNRLLEPFAMHTVLVTATEYNNFFDLRCPRYTLDKKTYFNSWKDLVKNEMIEKKACRDVIEELESYSFLQKIKCSESFAEIHIQTLAEAMWDARNESKPKSLKPGEWHIPFGDKIDIRKFEADEQIEIPAEQQESFRIQVSTARCARLSYMTYDGEINYKKDIDFHNRLLKDKHFSPFEHCAKTMNSHEYYTHYKGILEVNPIDNGTLGWSRNFKGFIQYREIIDNQ